MDIEKNTMDTIFDSYLILSINVETVTIFLSVYSENTHDKKDVIYKFRCAVLVDNCVGMNKYYILTIFSYDIR